jgi:hypothetical protein
MKQPEGLPEGSRGLSNSDTPGRKLQSFPHPAGVPEPFLIPEGPATTC